MVSIRKAKQSAFKLRRKGRRGKTIDAESVGLIAAALCLGFFITFLYSVAFSESSDSAGEIPESLRKVKKHPVLMETTEDGDAESGNEKITAKLTKRMNNGMNAIALDIVESLNCTGLLKEAENSLKSLNMGGFVDGIDDGLANARRRLEQDDDSIPEEKWGDLADKDLDLTPLDDFKLDDESKEDGGFGNYHTLSAKHLFCIAASEDPPEVVTNKIVCDGSKRKRKTLLELWSAARSQMTLDLLKKVLDLASVRTLALAGAM